MNALSRWRCSSCSGEPWLALVLVVAADALARLCEPRAHRGIERLRALADLLAVPHDPLEAALVEALAVLAQRGVSALTHRAQDGAHVGLDSLEIRIATAREGCERRVVLAGAPRMDRQHGAQV